MRNYFVWVCIFAITALTLYDLKYNVRTVQVETHALEQQLIDEKRRLATLEVEWTYVSRPERIKALAKRHLKLHPIASSSMMETENAMWQASHVALRKTRMEKR